MNRRMIALTVPVLTITLTLSVLALWSAGCHKHDHAQSIPSAAVASDFVNTRCPIMGSKINPAEVKPELTREYKGQKVAFCCGGCPSAWDKLSDAEKDAKLAAAK